MHEQLQLVEDGPDRDRWSDFDADFTPPGVIRQGLAALQLLDRRGRMLDRATATPGAIWDPCAGSGAFGMVARSMFLDSVLVATEPRLEERPHLEHHYHHVCMGEFAAGWPVLAPARPSWIVTNPPWSRWTELVERAWPLVEAGALLALLGPVGWGSSFEPADGLEVLHRCRPVAELRIPHRIKFRRGTNPRTGQPYGSDHRKCAWWVFMRQPARRPKLLRWSTYVLPLLPKADYEWIVRPGTEYLSGPMVARV